MGNDVRIERPEERDRRHWKDVLQPIGWGLLGVAVIASVVWIAKLMRDGSVVATSQTATQSIDINNEGGKAQPMMQDPPDRTVLVGPDGIATSVPGEGQPVLPSGTDTVPKSPALGAATSDAGGLIYIDSRPTGLMAIISDQEPEKYIGHAVNVQGAYVQRVLGERAFALGPSADDFVVVKFPSGDGKRWATVVEPGAILSVDGKLQQMPSENASDKMFGLFAPRPSLGKAKVYIEATNIGPKRQ
jgi:hypothetical protein